MPLILEHDAKRDLIPRLRDMRVFMPPVARAIDHRPDRQPRLGKLAAALPPEAFERRLDLEHGLARAELSAEPTKHLVANRGGVAMIGKLDRVLDHAPPLQFAGAVDPFIGAAARQRLPQPKRNLVAAD